MNKPNDLWQRATFCFELAKRMPHSDLQQDLIDCSLRFVEEAVQLDRKSRLRLVAHAANDQAGGCHHSAA